MIKGPVSGSKIFTVACFLWCNSPPPTPVGQGHLIIEASRSHSDTPHSVGLLWTSDQPDAENSTRQNSTLTRDRHPCLRREPNSRSQLASGLRQRSHWDRHPYGYSQGNCDNNEDDDENNNNNNNYYYYYYYYHYYYYYDDDDDDENNNNYY